MIQQEPEERSRCCSRCCSCSTFSKGREQTPAFHLTPSHIISARTHQAKGSQIKQLSQMLQHLSDSLTGKLPALFRWRLIRPATCSWSLMEPQVTHHASLNRLGWIHGLYTTCSLHFLLKIILS